VEGLEGKRVYKAFHRTKTKVQKLNWRDYPLRVAFWERYLQACQQNPNFGSQIMFPDEARFNENGIFNSKNNICWAVENPHASWTPRKI